MLKTDTVVRRIGIRGGMRGEDHMGRDARAVTGANATDAEAINGIFRSGVFRGRSYAGGAGLPGLFVTGTIHSAQREEVLRSVAKALKHSRNIANVLF